MKQPIHVLGYFGIGDNIYQRPFIKRLCEIHQVVYLETPVPEIYVGCGGNVRFVRPKSMYLRTQQKIVDRMPDVLWTEPPPGVDTLRLAYHYPNNKGLCHRKGNSVVECFGAQIPGADPERDFRMTVPKAWREAAREHVSTNAPICLIKPPTLRKEWEVPSRNPLMRYYSMLINQFRNDFAFVSVADIQKGAERIDGKMPAVDLRLHKGQLTLPELVGLTAIAEVVICCPSFMLPMAAMTGTRTLCLFGGYMAPPLIVEPWMDAEVAAPMPFCNCFEPAHKCNKILDEEEVLAKFTKLKNRGRRMSKKKSTLMIARLGPEWTGRILANPLIRERYDIVALDRRDEQEYVHLDLADIVRLENVRDARNAITVNDVDLAIVSQKLFPLSDEVWTACEEYNVPIIWAEQFFDNKLVLDRVGLQYEPDNEIVQFVDKIEIDEKADWPKTTRQPQAKDLQPTQLLRKYHLAKDGKYIVVFGQTAFDMSLRHAILRKVPGQRQFIERLAQENSDVTFLLKEHPQYRGVHAYRRDEDMAWVDRIPNVVQVDESLTSLFTAFDRFASFSSTTILEGVMRGRPFATAGFHYLNNPTLVMQLRTTELYSGIYDRLETFKPDPETLERYLKFICNRYAIDVGSERLIHRLESTSEEYFL